ncbi:EID1-like F-box protein 1 [Podospora aff. communis PSN243]|uniref:EID1-like F-box protein 1 n=1 Tax=Podospora aff. communis PSN243 TaxID=3040156 RepID=A0AAV9G8M8_9PEZI|nr:EID1-like F-box protein 1 [Podospora aff. communis PSN243]
MKQTLTDLPVDVLLIIFANLHSARDLRALALQNKSLSHLIRDDGWRVFVRNRFPSLSVQNPSQGNQSWQQLAESLTFQSRCWDKRALQFHGLFPVREGQAGGRRAQGHLFQPVVDSWLDEDEQEEMVVWGAGEDIVARYRKKGGEVKCARAQGRVKGFKSGYDDIRAVSVVKGQRGHDGSRVMVTGRDSGELVLLSAELERFGERLVEFRPASVDGEDESSGSSVTTAHGTINSVDVVRGGTGSLVAAATKSSVLVYEVPQDDRSEAYPLTAYDLRPGTLATSGAPLSRPQLCRATWMGQDGLIALALKGCKDPLRYLEMTPTGWVQHTAAKNLDLEREFGIGYGNICSNSLQPVQPNASSRGGTSLLLSAWRDGSCRLQDLRTPSPFDAIYEDNIDPWADMESLLVHGTERFVGGGMNGATIKIFDFRWTKGYYHTSGLPCREKRPYPKPTQPFLKEPSISSYGHRCNHVLGTACQWHGLSRDIYYRPNATFFLSKDIPGQATPAVWSLSKPSDHSPNFYVGISGGILEANLAEGGIKYDPNFGFEDWEDTMAPGGYRSRSLRHSMMETGDGLLVQSNDRAVDLPPILRRRSVGAARTGKGRGRQIDAHYRLDDGILNASEASDIRTLARSIGAMTIPAL